MLQIQKHSARIEHAENLAVKASLSLVPQVMDGKARHDSVELAKFGKRRRQVVLDDASLRVSTTDFAQDVEHRRGKIDRYGFCVRTRCLHQAEQPPAAATEIEKSIEALWQKFEQRAFALAAMRNLIGTLQIVFGMFRVGPQVYIRARMRWQGRHRPLHAPSVSFRVFQRPLHLFAQHLGEDRAAYDASTRPSRVGGAITIREHAV